jgi:putative Holliday junction resolvase
MRRGVRLAVDVGSVRVGVAVCDPGGVLATPALTLRRGHGDVEDLARLAAEHQPLEVLVGLPTSLSGSAGRAAAQATAYAEALSARLAPVPVRLVDERFSTVTAARNLKASGRTARSARPVVDQAAAVVILQSALDQERATGEPAGSVVQAGEPARPAPSSGAAGRGHDPKAEE